MGPALCLLLRWLLQESGDLCLHTPPSPTQERVKVNKVEILLAVKGTKHYHFVTYLTALKNTLGRAVLLTTHFLQLFKGGGIDDSVQVRRTQTCAHWLMTKPYINVGYDRLHRDGVWNANDAARQLSVTSFDLPHTPEQPLRRSGDLGLYCYSLVDREARHLPLSPWNTNQQWDALGAAICSHSNNHRCFQQPSRDQTADSGR